MPNRAHGRKETARSGLIKKEGFEMRDAQVFGAAIVGISHEGAPTTIQIGICLENYRALHCMMEKLCSNGVMPKTRFHCDFTSGGCLVYFEEDTKSRCPVALAKRLNELMDVVVGFLQENPGAEALWGGLEHIHADIEEGFRRQQDTGVETNYMLFDKNGDGVVSLGLEDDENDYSPSGKLIAFKDPYDSLNHLMYLGNPKEVDELCKALKELSIIAFAEKKGKK